MQRRTFIKNTSTLAIAIGSTPMMANTQFFKDKPFKMCLNAGAVGIDGSPQELIDLAAKNGFAAVVPSTGAITSMSMDERKALVDQLKVKNLSWGSGGLPMDFRKSEAEFREGLNELPAHAAALQEVGGTRVNTWIMPMHAELTYRQNFAQHTRRLKAIANILGHYGIRFGLEYVGPKTLMTREKYAFIRTMAEGKELIAAIDEPNVGFVLDSFHWFCAGENATDILTLDKEDVVTVDLNDARKGFAADEQIDGKRELPAATGVIDIKAFLNALVQIGYNGPVRAEPFNAPLRAMDNEEAAKATYTAMRKAFDMV